MKNLAVKMCLVLLFIVFCSCATTSSNSEEIYNPILQTDTVIGSVITDLSTNNWSLWAIGHISGQIQDQAYILLLAEAKKNYQGLIDVRNVTVAYSKLENGLAFYNAKGDVVLTDNSNRNLSATGVEGALARAAEQALKNVPQKSKIAIVYITAQDRSTTEYIAGELEFIWVTNSYIIIDRSQLDRIRREQDFQMSGEVDDDTAIFIGKIIGADIIVTGRVDGEDNLRRLRLRALNIQTAQVVGVASERL